MPVEVELLKSLGLGIVKLDIFDFAFREDFRLIVCWEESVSDFKVAAVERYRTLGSHVVHLIQIHDV